MMNRLAPAAALLSLVHHFAFIILHLATASDAAVVRVDNPAGALSTFPIDLPVPKWLLLRTVGEGFTGSPTPRIA
jgi:hypothetical protein